MRILWVFPFASFLAGYFLCLTFFSPPYVVVPSIVGMNTTHATLLLSSYELNLRILQQKIKDDLPDGVVLEQFPTQEKLVKPHQHVYVVVSQRPRAEVMPDVVGLSEKQLQEKVASNHVNLERYWIAGEYPSGVCCAQYPSPDADILETKPIVYLGKKQRELFLFPDCRSFPLKEVKDFLDDQDVSVKIHYVDENKNARSVTQGVVVAQKPVPGTLVDVKRLHVQLGVKSHDI